MYPKSVHMELLGEPHDLEKGPHYVSLSVLITTLFFDCLEMNISSDHTG